MNCENLEWSSIQASTNAPDSIIEAFFRIANQHADRIALRFKEQVITYSMLAQRVYCIANSLQKQTISDNSVIALCMDKSPDVIASMLAILHCGCIYMPIDPATPASRLQFMLNDGSPALVLCSDAYTSLFTDLNLTTLTLGAMDERDVEITHPKKKADSVYLLYTSGSTGNPKGVLIPDAGILRLIERPEWIDLNCEDRILFHSPYTFDASTFEIWSAILNGLTLVIYPKKTINIISLDKYIEEQGITTIWLTAALFHVVANHKPDFATKLKNLVVGGDTLQSKAIERVLSACPQLTIINGYGPTENTVFTTCYPMRSTDVIPVTVPVGKPVADTRLYVLNEKLEIVAQGEPGELYVAGRGLATGYLNRPDLNAKCFIEIDGIENGGTLYKTGDLVRLDSTGLLHFIGRVDDQVKVSGYRIELKEIETVLLQLSSIVECAVVAPRNENGDRTIAAFLKTTEVGAISNIKLELKKHLPDYMIPSVFHRMEDFPLNANGKIDRKKLESII